MDRKLIISIILLSPAIIFAMAADLIAPYPPLRTGVGPSLSPPSPSHIMGTDQLGSDIFSQVIYGSRTALLVSLLTGLISLLIALAIGLFSGYYGGLADIILMRMADLFLSLPGFILIILFLAVYGSTLTNIIIIMGLLSWPIMSRIARSQTMSLRGREFVIAAKALGDSDISIMIREILPNIWPSVMPALFLQMSLAILIESGISFIGLGDPNIASWGKTLSLASRALYIGSWWGALFPGLMLTITILGLNLLGDYLAKRVGR